MSDETGMAFHHHMVTGSVSVVMNTSFNTLRRVCCYSSSSWHIMVGVVITYLWRSQEMITMMLSRSFRKEFNNMKGIVWYDLWMQRLAIIR